MNKLQKALSSRTVWTIVAMFIVGGINSVMGFIPVELVPYVQGGLGLLAMYFKLSPSQDYSK